MFRFLHTADILLDCFFKGLKAHADSPVEEIYGATRRAFANCIDLAIDEAVGITNTIPLPYNVTLFEPHSQVQELLRTRLLRHGEPK